MCNAKYNHHHWYKKELSKYTKTINLVSFSNIYIKNIIGVLAGKRYNHINPKRQIRKYVENIQIQLITTITQNLNRSQSIQMLHGHNKCRDILYQLFSNMKIETKSQP